MVAPLLVASSRAATPQIGTTTGTDFAQIGDNLPSVETGGADIFSPSRVVNAFGSVYAMHGTGLYRLQTGSNFGTWSNDPVDGGINFNSFPVLGDVISQEKSKSGVYFSVVDNEPYLFGMFWDGNDVRSWRYNLLTQTAEVSAGVNTFAGTDIHGTDILYNGQVYWWHGNFNQMWTVNANSFGPPGLIDGDFSSPTFSGQQADFDVFDGRLFAVGRDPNIPTVYELVGSTFFKLFALPGTANASTQGRYLLFNDDTSMYVVYYDVTSGDWRIYQINFVSGAPQLGSELSVLPTAIIDSSSDSRLWANKVYNTDGTSDILIYHAEGGSTQDYAQYTWNGPNSQLTFGDQAGGLTGNYSVPNLKSGSGDRTYIGESATVTVYARERVSGGERVTFRVHPPIDPGPSSVTTGLVVRFFVGTGGGPPDTQAQLIGSATGGTAIRSGNQVSNVDADDTDYTITIQAVGFGDFDKIELTARVSAV